MSGITSGERATQKRQERAEREQAHAARILLSLEIEHNLQLLRAFWGRINKTPQGPNDDPTSVAVRMANQLVDLPLPNWSHKAWESQLTTLPLALNRDAVIKQAYAHHAGLDAIASIKDKLTSLRQEQSEEWRAQQEGGIVKSLLSLPMPFTENAVALCKECEQAVNNVLSIDNPIPQEKPTR